MAQPYIGEIRMFAGNFAPAGWLFCQGQLLAISENDTLFTVIGVTYGGDGSTTFALPDLRGRVPIHTGGSGNGALGQQLGTEAVTLAVSQIPTHDHALLATTTAANSGHPQNSLLADVSPATFYDQSDPSGSPLAAQSVSSVGGSQAHTNMMPYVALNYIISLFGILPTPT